MEETTTVTMRTESINLARMNLLSTISTPGRIAVITAKWRTNVLTGLGLMKILKIKTIEEFVFYTQTGGREDT